MAQDRMCIMIGEYDYPDVFADSEPHEGGHDLAA